MRRTPFHRLAVATTLLTLVVVLLGAYVRLSDAGLGCPDWPGCYGRFAVPEQPAEVAEANQSFPERPLEAAKAWKEMAHRYLAGALGLLVLILAVMAWRNRHDPDQPVVLPLVLLGLVIFQALLGMWTVTLLLKPLIVSAHLLGGFATLALLLLLVLRHGGHLQGLQTGLYMRWAAGLVLLVLVGQIFLGAWTSSNYAALACSDFPTCQGGWWPSGDLGEAFTLWRGLGVNYEYGVLDNPARATIQMTHRLGALVTTLVITVFGLWLLLTRRMGGLRLLGLGLIVAVLLQVTLGISLIYFHLPLPLAVAHNGGAALLLLLLVAINHSAWSEQQPI